MPFFAHFCSINPFPLRIKQFLRRPESLLLIGMLIGPFIYRETMIDIQLHDTYYVFGEGRLVGNHFYWYIDIVLLVSWLLHILLKRQKLLSPVVQWVFASLSLILLLGLKALTIFLDQGFHRRPTGLEAFLWNAGIFEFFPKAIAIFILQQLIFWINAEHPTSSSVPQQARSRRRVQARHGSGLA
jgi:hypothetical protein